jgi:hypothetical protein
MYNTITVVSHLTTLRRRGSLGVTRCCVAARSEELQFICEDRVERLQVRNPPAFLPPSVSSACECALARLCGVRSRPPSTAGAVDELTLARAGIGDRAAPPRHRRPTSPRCFSAECVLMRHSCIHNLSKVPTVSHRAAVDASYVYPLASARG